MIHYEEKRKQLWVLSGFSNSFFVLSDTAGFEFKCTDCYDPSLNISWTIDYPILADKDSSASSLADFK
jgi:dTDP-4-dehydrorhamnose 3,5-epimerase